MNKNITTPLVSVIVPSFNHAQYITKCILSIMNQTYTNFELVVIDDGSTDNSLAILKKLQKEHRFKLIYQHNSGLANTLNRGIQEFSKGKYITFCASDDYWTYDKLEKQVKFMEENPNIPMCYGKAYIVNYKNEIISKLTISSNKHLKGGNIFKDLLFINFHPPVNYLFKKNIFNEVGYYANTWAEDFYMNLRIAEKYEIGYINSFISYYRIFPYQELKLTNQKTINSHYYSINQYKHSCFYKNAIKMWHYRNFLWLSKFKATKKIAFIGLFRNLDHFYQIKFIKSLIKFIFIWK